MKQLVAVLVVALVLISARPVLAQDMTCDMTTIASLSMCVQHAQQMGLIDNAGVARSLFSIISAAQAAYDSGNTATAVYQLQSFINLVEAQAGIHIDATYAQHVIMHAQNVIAVISSP